MSLKEVKVRILCNNLLDYMSTPRYFTQINQEQNFISNTNQPNQNHNNFLFSANTSGMNGMNNGNGNVNNFNKSRAMSLNYPNSYPNE